MALLQSLHSQQQEHQRPATNVPVDSPSGGNDVGAATREGPSRIAQDGTSETRVAQLEAQLREKDKVIEWWQAQKGKSDASRDAARASSARSKVKLSQQDTLIQELQRNINKQSAAVAATHTHLETHEATINKAHHQLRDKVQAMEAVERSLHAATLRIQTLETALAEAQSEVTQKTVAIEVLQANHLAATASLDSNAALLESAQDAIIAKDTLILDLTNERETAATAAAFSAAEAQQVRETQRERESAAVEQEVSYATMMQDAQDAITAKDKRIEEFVLSREAASSRLAEQEETIARLNENVRDLAHTMEKELFSIHLAHSLQVIICMCACVWICIYACVRRHVCVCDGVCRCVYDRVRCV